MTATAFWDFYLRCNVLRMLGVQSPATPERWPLFWGSQKKYFLGHEKKKKKIGQKV